LFFAEQGQDYNDSRYIPPHVRNAGQGPPPNVPPPQNDRGDRGLYL